MFDPKKLEQIAAGWSNDSMPQPVKELGSDVDQKVRQVIQGQLNKLDVVEEFDVQTFKYYCAPVKKLTEMEQKLRGELEAALAEGKHSSEQTRGPDVKRQPFLCTFVLSVQTPNNTPSRDTSFLTTKRLGQRRPSLLIRCCVFIYDSSFGAL